VLSTIHARYAFASPWLGPIAKSVTSDDSFTPTGNGPPSTSVGPAFSIPAWGKTLENVALEEGLWSDA
jgi:hypothetical protein